MEWLSTLKDLWWLAGLAVALLAFVWRTAIKTNRLLGQVENVKAHDNEIKQIKEDIDDLKGEMQGVRETLNMHIVDQKVDTRITNSTLLTILDLMTDPSKKNDQLEKAKAELRNRLLDK